jgi:peptidoglycan/LPS O-acetylase OafA/YrhL
MGLLMYRIDDKRRDQKKKNVQSLHHTFGAARVDRLDNIDALRGFAVLAVMLFHYTVQPVDYVRFDHPVWSAYYGKFGVELFFVISGYCISMTAVRCPDLAKFWACRFSRLYPAYVAAILVTFTVVSIFGLPGLAVSGRQAVGNMLWLNAQHIVPYVDPVYWSLLVELKLYVAFGIVFYAVSRRDRNPVLWWSLLCLIGGVVWKVDEIVTGWQLTRYTFSMVTFIFPYSGFFLAGMLGFWWSSCNIWIRILALATYLIACVCLATTLTEAAILMAIFPVTMIVLSKQRLPIAAPVVFLGFTSYPLYLIHGCVGLVIIRETALIPWEYARILLAIVVVVSIATILSLTIEHRFRRAIEEPVRRFLSGALALAARTQTLIGLSASRPKRQDF